MIEVEIQSKRRIISIAGHATRGSRQKYQVCAAVSVIAQALREYAPLQGSLLIPGKTVKACFEFAKLDFLWFVTFRKTFKALAKSYPAQIKVREVR